LCYDETRLTTQRLLESRFAPEQRIPTRIAEVLGIPSRFMTVGYFKMKNPQHGTTLILRCFSVLIISLIWIDSVGAREVRKVYLNGDIAPETDGRKFFSNRPPTINNSGDVAVTSILCCPGSMGSDSYGIWSETSGDLALVARSNRPAPGMLTGRFAVNGFGPPQLNNSGKVAFGAIVSDPNVPVPNLSTSGIWSTTAGSLQLVAGGFSHAAGTPADVQFYGFGDEGSESPALLNDHGLIAFRASLQGGVQFGVNDKGIWTSQNGVLTLVVRTGDAATDTSPGVVFRDVSLSQLNNAGAFTFSGMLAGTEINGGNDFGIWMQQGLDRRLLARRGDVVDAGPDGLVYAGLSLPDLNQLGHYAFRGSVAGPSITDANNERVWYHANGVTHEIARENDAAPGTSDGTVFSGGFHQPQLNDLGQIAFFSALAGPGISSIDEGGVWISENGTSELVARRGGTAPGLPTGVVINRFIVGPLNNLGQLLLRADLAGPGVTSNNDQCLWIWSRDQSLTMLLREGDLLDVSNGEGVGDLRILSQIEVHGLNDAGQALLSLRFANNSSGIFVLDAAQVPEPSTLGLIALTANCAAIASTRRRRTKVRYSLRRN
jgi:hypothetical protein